MKRITRIFAKLGKWERRLIIVGATIGSIVAFLAISISVVSRPETCGSCHEMEPAYRQWKLSSHYGVDCVECHTEPGLSGYMKIIWDGTGHLFQHILGDYDSVIETHITDSSCLRCHHMSERPESIPQASLRISHSKHTDQECDDCHGRLVHTELVTDTPTGVAPAHAARECTVCHELETCPHGHADVDCVSCHSGNIPNHEIGEKRGAMMRESCIECHEAEGVGSPGECRTCHFSPHGFDADCASCHSSTDSWTIRSFTHPVELKGTHAKLKCNRCHKENQFTGLHYVCDECHVPPHGDIGDDCQKCHEAGEWWIL